MPRYQWSRLNNQQVGAYFEYFVKMELAMFGFEVYTTEVDDRGIDFVARQCGAPFIEVQVKSLRDYGYIFMPKSYFVPRENLYVAVGLLFEGKEPLSFLVPATVWNNPDSVFVDRNYGAPGQKSKPEWGINLSRKNLPRLEQYAMASALESLRPAG